MPPASARATASRRGSRTPPRCSRSCSRRRASARSSRRAHPTSAPTASSTGSGRSRRRCSSRSTATSTTASSSTASCASARSPRCSRRSPRPSCSPYVDDDPDLGGVPGAVLWDAWLAPYERRRRRVRAAALRPPAVRPLLVGHDGPAEVHRAPRRRRPAEASRRAPAPVRRPTRRPRLLLHDDRLDDVELARVGARERGDARAVRRLPGARRGHGAVGSRRRARRHAVRHVGEVPRLVRQARAAPDRHARPRRRCARSRRPVRRSSPEGFEYVYGT